jgi:hypothetical protein
VSLEDPSDSAQTRQPSVRTFGPQRVLDGLRANESQIALSQFTPQSQDSALHTGLGLPSVNAWSVGLIQPVHPIQSLASCAGQPVLQVSQANPKATRHGALRLTVPRCRHHRLPFLFSEFVIARTLPN